MLLVFLSFQGTLARLAVIGRCSTYVYLVWRLPNKKNGNTELRSTGSKSPASFVSTVWRTYSDLIPVCHIISISKILVHFLPVIQNA